MVFRVLLAVCLLSFPASGDVVAGYSPGPGFGGHWGIDISTPAGGLVRAPADGVVVFAGSVAGMRTVSIDHPGGMRTSLSYLSMVSVSKGERVSSGDVIGRAGWPHGREGLHLSVRVNGEYVDPEPLLRCDDGVIRLLPPL